MLQSSSALFLSATCLVILATPSSENDYGLASTCDIDNCLLPNCRCIGTDIPAGLKPEQTPQFVFFTFDDAVQTTNYQYYVKAFYNKTNPDGCQVAGTFFVSHEYTEYDKVNDLYNHGQEIALHSISHTPNTDYWRTMSKEDLSLEFDGERTIISSFANIPIEHVKGMRLPFLQLSGNNTFEVAKEINLAYDSSWPTQRIQPGLWPYTLDYSTDQDCPIGPCPDASIPGVWVAPMLNWIDEDNIDCSMTDACVNIPKTADDIAQWIIKNFEKQYKSNKAPFGFYLHAAWFQVSTEHELAYYKFIDYLQSLPDVYIVGISTALEWIRNPLPIGSSDWPQCTEVQPTKCQPSNCELKKGNELRYMSSCVECPDVYPWLGNPLGKKV